jgi:hypothetical protein
MKLFPYVTASYFHLSTYNRQIPYNHQLTFFVKSFETCYATCASSSSDVCEPHATRDPRCVHRWVIVLEYAYTNSHRPRQ